MPYASMIANGDHGDAAILRYQHWLRRTTNRASSRLVRVSGLLKRTFDRRFRIATGYCPLGHVQALRIEKAKQQLEASAMPIETIARDVGCEDKASFRRHSSALNLGDGQLRLLTAHSHAINNWLAH